MVFVGENRTNNHRKCLLRNCSVFVEYNSMSNWFYPVREVDHNVTRDKWYVANKTTANLMYSHDRQVWHRSDCNPNEVEESVSMLLTKFRIVARQNHRYKRQRFDFYLYRAANPFDRVSIQLSFDSTDVWLRCQSMFSYKSHWSYHKYLHWTHENIRFLSEWIISNHENQF